MDGLWDVSGWVGSIMSALLVFTSARNRTWLSPYRFMNDIMNIGFAPASCI